MNNRYKSEITKLLNLRKSNAYNDLIDNYNSEINKIKECGGKASIQKQHTKVD